MNASYQTLRAHMRQNVCIAHNGTNRLVQVASTFFILWILFRFFSRQIKLAFSANLIRSYCKYSRWFAWLFELLVEWAPFFRFNECKCHYIAPRQFNTSHTFTLANSSKLLIRTIIFSSSFEWIFLCANFVDRNSFRNASVCAGYLSQHQKCQTFSLCIVFLAFLWFGRPKTDCVIHMNICMQHNLMALCM